MMNASVGDDPDSATAMLKTVTDSDVYKERLKVLNAKVAESKGFLEQARAENLKMEATRAQAEAINADVLKNLEAITAKESTVAQREGALAAREAKVRQEEIALAVAKADFQAEVDRTQSAFKKQAQDLTKAQFEFDAEKSKTKTANEKWLTEAQAKLAADTRAAFIQIEEGRADVIKLRADAKALMAKAEEQEATVSKAIEDFRKATVK